MSKYPTVAFDATERVLVIGLGRSGRASAEVLRNRGATVFATDEKPGMESDAGVTALRERDVQFVAPDALGTVFAGVTAAVVSPGVPINSALVRSVQDAGIPVFSEVEVAYRICRAPIVAISGTKGKTTTTSLVGHLLSKTGKPTHVGGNIGNPLIYETAKAAPNDWVVAEVSSFQLESIRSFKPRISLILNITPDHLDRYHSMDEYAEAKFRIFANQGPGDTFIGNLDDERVGALASGESAGRVKCRALWFAKSPHRNTTLYLRNESSIVYAPPTGDPRPVEIMTVDEIPLLGRHNVENVMGAMLIALVAGLEPDAIRAAVREFKPLSHHLETVAEIDGVTYVDDSKATNPSSAMAGMRSFERPVVLIAGGRAKRTDFSDLGKVISSRAKAVVLIGEAADELAATIKRAPVKRATTMQDAVEQAAALAEPGDVVLLSPSAASLDMFDSAEHRGTEFARAVRSLEGRRPSNVG